MKRTGKKNPRSYLERNYRSVLETGALVSSFAQVKDTDLHILADRDVSGWASDCAVQYRLQVEKYILDHPEFVQSLSPLPRDRHAPAIVRDMFSAGSKAGVGPMAAVAGVIAEYVGRDLLTRGIREVMVENGGDIFLHRSRDCTVAIFAGESPLSLQVGIKVSEQIMPAGVCTSSGTVGHSLSFGCADSVTVLSKSTALADAVATRLGNEVGMESGQSSRLEKALKIGRNIDGVLGVVVICGDKIGAVGDVELVKTG